LSDSPTAAPIAPRIIPRDEHGISRRFISPNALRVLYRLNEAGHQAYLVGGAVRDLLLGGRPKDFDVATDATPDEVRRLFRNCRLIGRRFRLAHVIFGPEIIEVATFRGNEPAEEGEGERHVVDGMIVRDNVWGSIEDDALRRDFTANSLYYTVADFSVRDWTGGYEDVRNRVLRLIGDPATRYREDPVRMLRAVRLAAKLEFRIDDAAWSAIFDLAPLIADSAPARLFDELLKLFMGGHAFESMRWLEASHLFHELFPGTAHALQRDGGFQVPRLLELALEGTDARIAAGRPVTPAFLLAALLWPALEAALAEDAAAHRDMHDPQLALTRAANRVVREQSQRITLPKRFMLPMMEIWQLQRRFEQTQRRKATRFLSHPRYRAAFDFLELRAHDETRLKPLVDWWAALAAAPGSVDADGPKVSADPLAALPGVDDAAHEEVRGPKRKRRRRRRKRGGGGATVAMPTEA
jgi:poly(A) polymerase